MSWDFKKINAPTVLSIIKYQNDPHFNYGEKSVVNLHKTLKGRKIA